MKSAYQIEIEGAVAAGAAPQLDGETEVRVMRVPRDVAEKKLEHLRARLEYKVNTLLALGLDSGVLYDEAVQIQADVELLEEALEHGSVVREVES